MPIRSEQYNQQVLEKVKTSTEEPRTRFTVESLRTVLDSQKLGGALTEINPAAEALLGELAYQANIHGLTPDDFQVALGEIQEQLDIESNTAARHAHEKERSETKLNSLANAKKLFGLRVQSMLETLGRGAIAKKAHDTKHERLNKREYMGQVAQAAIERASIRKRYDTYLKLGGEEFNYLLKLYRDGKVTRADVAQERGFNQGIENILDGTELPDPFVVGQDAAGNNIEVKLTPASEALIKNHLRFLLRDEVLQLSQISQMKVMETDAYRVDQQDAWGIVRKFASSGTLWGMGTRTGLRMAIGGSLLAGNVGVIIAAAGIGAVAGAASQYAEYKFARRKQKKMDLAVGARQATVKLEDGRGKPYEVQVTKQSEQINQTLKTQVEALQQLSQDVKTDDTKYVELAKAIKAAYTTVMDAEWRLVASRQDLATSRPGEDKQDYIAFGLENRLRATLDLTHNLKEASRAIQTAKDAYAERIAPGFVDADFDEELVKIAKVTKRDITALQAELESALFDKSERNRLLTGAALGGLFAGVSATAMDLIHGWFDSHGVNPGEVPTFQNTNALTVQHEGQTLTVHPTAPSDPRPGLVLRDAAGVEKVINLPAGVDAQHVVVTNDLDIYNATTGEPVGHINVEVAPAVAETLKAPQLTSNLSVDGGVRLAPVQGKDFGLSLDEQGNLGLYNVKPDGSLDLSQPVVPKSDILSEELRARLAAMPAEAKAAALKQATQLYAETQTDGTIVVKSVYDSSVIAEYHVDASGAVTAAEAPVPVGATSSSTELLDRIFADPNSDIVKLLNKMGVQAGELSKDGNGNLGLMNSEVVDGEYLGRTAGWRQTRFDMLLQAKQQGKIVDGESADMIVARLERATRHMLLESDKYDSSTAALDEAFGKDASFIQKNELPWINGPKSVVSNDWEKLVDQMRQLPDQVSTTAPVAPDASGVAAPVDGAAPVGTVAPGGNDIVSHQIGSATVFNEAKPAQVAASELAATEASRADNAIAYGLDAALLLAGLAAEQPVYARHTSHLVGAEQEIKKGFGTRLDDFTFEQAPENPDPAAEAEKAYEAAEQSFASDLELLYQRMGELQVEWAKSTHPVDTNYEKEVLNLARALSSDAETRLADPNLFLDEAVPGKSLVTLREYFDNIVQTGVDAEREVLAEADKRAQWAKGTFDQHLSEELPQALASADKEELEPYLAQLKSDQKYIEVIDKNLEHLFTIAPSIAAGIRETLRNVKEAIRQVEEHLVTLGAESEAEAPAEGAGAGPEADSADGPDAAAKKSTELTEIDSVIEDYERLDAKIAAKFRAEYLDRGHAEVFDALNLQMLMHGIWERDYLVALDNYLEEVEGYGTDRLVRSGLVQADGSPDLSQIELVISLLKNDPTKNPFPPDVLKSQPAEPSKEKAAEVKVVESEPAKKLERELDAEFVTKLIAQLNTLGMKPADQVQMLNQLHGNWARLYQQEEYLGVYGLDDKLATLDVRDDAGIARLAQRMDNVLKGLDPEKRLFILAEVPERYDGEIRDKLRKINRRFGGKFSTAVSEHLSLSKDNQPRQDDVAQMKAGKDRLGKFNEAWNQAGQKYKELATLKGEELLKRVGVIGTNDQFDNTKAVEVFERIVANDEAWLEAVAKGEPESATGLLKDNDNEF